MFGTPPSFRGWHHRRHTCVSHRLSHRTTRGTMGRNKQCTGQTMGLTQSLVFLLFFRIKPQVIFCLKAQNPQRSIFSSFNSQPNSTFCPIPSSAFFTLTLTLPQQKQIPHKRGKSTKLGCPPRIILIWARKISIFIIRADDNLY